LLGARDFGRIDIKLDEYGKPNFLEANLVPGMTPGTSYFPRALSYLNSSGKILTMPDGMTHSEIALKNRRVGFEAQRSVRSSATPISLWRDLKHRDKN
jgi:D-alanine-D-alanine ligase